VLSLPRRQKAEQLAALDKDDRGTTPLDEPGRWTSLLGWAIRKRVLLGALRHLAERALSGIGLDIEVEGVKLRCYLGDNATERDIFVRGLHARKVGLMRVMEDLKPGDVFVDVGAK